MLTPRRSNCSSTFVITAGTRGEINRIPAKIRFRLDVGLGDIGHEWALRATFRLSG